jgi:hypothetical protein
MYGFVQLVAEAVMITHRHARPTTPEQLLDRIRGEFAALPGLRLTKAQARRIWGLSFPDCESLLQRLIDARFLARDDDGTYVRADLPRLLATTLPPRGPRARRRVA